MINKHIGKSSTVKREGFEAELLKAVLEKINLRDNLNDGPSNSIGNGKT